MTAIPYQANVGLDVRLRSALWGLGAVLQDAFCVLITLWWPVLILVGAVWACLLYPALPLGLAITAVVGWVTYPRPKQAMGRGRLGVCSC